MTSPSALPSISPLTANVRVSLIVPFTVSVNLYPVAAGELSDCSPPIASDIVMVAPSISLNIFFNSPAVVPEAIPYRILFSLSIFAFASSFNSNRSFSCSPSPFTSFGSPHVTMSCPLFPSISAYSIISSAPLTSMSK